MQGGGLVDAKPRSLTYIFTIPTSANILPFLRSYYHPLFLCLRIIVHCTCECAITRVATGDYPIACICPFQLHVPMYMYTTMLHAYIHVQRVYATLQQFPYLGSRYLGYKQGDIYNR